MLLAADVGGTKTLLGLFEPDARRPARVRVGEFVTLAYDGPVPMVREFLAAARVEATRIDAAAFGVAGAVSHQVARLTNVPWLVDAAAIQKAAGFRCVGLINDLEAMAHSVMVLEPAELAELQAGTRQPRGNAAVIAAGTGLGQALLHRLDGRFVPAASEAGHADWGARTVREIELLQALTRLFGRVDVETVISGPGLVNIYQFTHDAFGTTPYVSGTARVPRRLCEGVGAVTDPAMLPAAISQSAMAGRCPQCVEALDIFIAAYGAEAGNLALRSVASAGVYVGGGIAPKILPALRTPAFLDAFRAKTPMADFAAAIPIAVILNPEAGLLGAAVYAHTLAMNPERCG
ncbi:MAG TPA: glucokinase [Vicinamibacterales bacterium]|nr:glucokinase [Vicinamibacterales bacterium]